MSRPVMVLPMDFDPALVDCPECPALAGTRHCLSVHGVPLDAGLAAYGLDGYYHRARHEAAEARDMRPVLDDAGVPGGAWA